MKHIASRLISPFLFSIVLSERVSFCSKVVELMQFPIKCMYIFSKYLEKKINKERHIVNKNGFPSSFRTKLDNSILKELCIKFLANQV